MKRLYGGQFAQANALAILLVPRNLLGPRGPGSVIGVTAVLAAAAATVTMVSGSSGLAAARFLSRTFLRESAGDFFLSGFCRFLGPLDPTPWCRPLLGPPGRDLGWGGGAAGP